MTESQGWMNSGVFPADAEVVVDRHPEIKRGGRKPHAAEGCCWGIRSLLQPDACKHVGKARCPQTEDGGVACTAQGGFGVESSGICRVVSCIYEKDFLIQYTVSSP